MQRQVDWIREYGLRVYLAEDGFSVVAGPRRLLCPIIAKRIYYAMDTIREELWAEQRANAAPRQAVALPSVAGLPCPYCHKPTDDKGRCWRCHNRICEQCAVKDTGSAFIALCLICERLEPPEQRQCPESCECPMCRWARRKKGVAA